jgi:uncharacterized protein
MRTNIEFNADGVTLRGWFYKPDSGKGPFPTVVMAHGFTATKEMTLDRYAEVFAGGGLAVLVYDNRTLGDSDGLPRHNIDPTEQMRDYRYAVTYAQSCGDVDPSRIGLWGTSYTGGTVITVAALDRRVKAIVSQVPFVKGIANIKQFLPISQWDEFAVMLDEDRKRRMNGEPSQYIPVTTDDPNGVAAFPGIRTHRYFNDFASSVPGIKWENKVTVRSIEFLMEYDVTAFASQVSPTPMMMIVSDRDKSATTELALEVFQLAREPKELVISRADHYASYIEDFAMSSAAARDFFLKHL